MWIIVAIVQTVVVFVIIWAMVSFGLFGFMILGILLILLIIFLLVSAINGGLKGIAATFVSFVLGFVLFNYYYGYQCEPDPEDVKVMKPMAEVISEYIVKHGIPKSLSKIPNLPYRLEGCEKKEGYPYSLFCTFNKDYSVEFADDPNHRYYSVNFYAPNSSTGMDIDFKVIDGNRLILEKSTPRLPNPHIYSSKITGICNPMRQ